MKVEVEVYIKGDMMNKIILIGLLLVSFPTFAGTLTGEYGLLQPGNAQFLQDNFAKKYSLTYVEGDTVVVGGTLEAVQADDGGELTGELSGLVGYNTDPFAGFTTLGYGEVGKSLSDGNNYNFWGAGVTVSKEIVSSVNAFVGYRYRQNFENADVDQKRVHGGLTFAVSEAIDVAVAYYRDRGFNDVNEVGLSVSRKF